MKGRIDRVAYIGWRGIEYEEIALDSGSFTGLVGPSGAGKSTLAMCLDYALLPDRRVLDIHPISDLQDPHKAGVDALAARIHPKYGYAYVVLDVSTRLGARLVAGIHVRIEDGRGEFTRWYINPAPAEAVLQDLLRVIDGDQEYYPDYPDLRRHLAARGIDFHICRTVGEYGQMLYEAGVLPTNLIDGADRALYGKLIETSFRGGISHDVATKLKDYVLPPARRIPETISKLQECTNQVFRTRRTLKDAQGQLVLLQTTYGTGKEIVTHAIRQVSDRLSECKTQLEYMAREKQAKNLKKKDLDDTLRSTAEQIKTTEETINTLQSAHRTQLEQAESDREQLTTEEQTRKTQSDSAAADVKRMKDGESAWRKIAGAHTNRGLAAVEDWLKNDYDRLSTEIAKVTTGIERSQEERAALDAEQGSAAATALARSLGGITLEETLKGVSEADARALEMGLNGLINGVVGVTPGGLATLQDSDQYPDLFWVGEETPTLKTVRTVGDWFISANADGYVVSSKRRRLTFGAHAREERRKGLDDLIAKASAKRQQLNAERDKVDDRRQLLSGTRETLQFYLDNRSRILDMERSAAKAKEAYEETRNKLVATKASVQKLRDDLFKVTEPHAQALADLRVKADRSTEKITQLESEIAGMGPKEEELKRTFQACESILGDADRILGPYAPRLTTEAQKASSRSEAVYLIEQTKRLTALNDALKDETPTRLAALQAANAQDAMSCIPLWPMLVDVLRDRIPADLADIDGEDLIDAMQQRRLGLDEQLRVQEQEVRIQARTVHSAISSEIASQRNRIRMLSRIGEGLRFGNVSGIRISVRLYDSMLSTLESFADQLPLFSQDMKPVDLALQEFFENTIGQKFSGEELLDYRTYMDLAIEAKREGAPDWELATSLSGGESIGCGLAIALMLARSLTHRGEVKSDQITLLFAVDEVHRLDSAGQGMIVDFGEREGFQVFVTAAALEPRYRCTLYALHRTFSPEERLILRGVRLDDKSKKAAT